MHSFYSYLNGADTYTKMQLIIFALQWNEQYEKYFLEKKLCIALNMKKSTNSRSVIG